MKGVEDVIDPCSALLCGCGWLAGWLLVEKEWRSQVGSSPISNLQNAGWPLRIRQSAELPCFCRSARLFRALSRSGNFRLPRALVALLPVCCCTFLQQKIGVADRHNLNTVRFRLQIWSTALISNAPSLRRTARKITGVAVCRLFHL